MIGLTTLGMSAQPGPPRFTVPDGFAVEEVHPPAASGSIVAIAFDAGGRLVASRELGPVIRLIDENADGRTDSEQVITGEVTNAQGLEFDGADLLVVGEGPEGTGLYRVPDPDGDGQGETPRLLARTTTGIQEHGPHAVFFGPDGWLYWILGNHTALEDSPDPASPYRDRGEGQLLPTLTDPHGHAVHVRAPGGFIVRRPLGAEGADWQMVAGGFRNAYDAAFNATGELFTFDSDMEWDLDLPWYRPVRTYHVPPGAEFGWRTGTGLWAPYYPDALPPMREVGRGSPTGVTFYQGTRFPAEYRDAFFEADWSRGRILVGRLSRDGATYREEASEFVLGTPLNVTDVAAGPDGALYFSKGGRKTEGGIYRVVYRDRNATGRAPASKAWLETALDQPDHRSAWGRAAIRRALEQAGRQEFRDGLTRVALDSSAQVRRRARAVELLHTADPSSAGLPLSLLTTLAADAEADVRAAAVYYLGLSEQPAAREQLRAALGDSEPRVRRRALEALVRTGIRPGDVRPVDPVADVLPLLGDTDRFVRYAARELLVRTDRNAWREAALALNTFPAAAQAQVALAQTVQNPYDVRTVLERQLALVQTRPAPDDLAPLLRAVHLTMAADEGVELGKLYTPLAEALLARFPSGNAALDRELSLALAYLRPPEAIAPLVARLHDGVDRERQIWIAYLLRRFEAGWTPELRDAVVSWFQKTQDEQWKGGVSFAGYLAFIWHDFVTHQPAADREALLAAIPALAPAGSRPGQDAPWKNRGNTSTLSERELREYLELDPMAYQGSAEKGREVFEQAFCGTCHRVGSVGQNAGPDLTDVGRRFERKDMLDAILYPSRTISEQWAAVEFVTDSKESYVGTIRAEDSQAVVLLTVAGDEVRLPKRNIASRTSATISAMPEGLLNGLSLEQIRDLLTFLERGSE